MKFPVFLLFISVLKVSCSDDFATLSDEDYAVPEACNYCDDFVRKTKRHANPPYNSRILDVMLNTPMYQWNRSEPDVFEAFRDQYELPSGKIKIILFFITVCNPI